MASPIKQIQIERSSRELVISCHCGPKTNSLIERSEVMHERMQLGNGEHWVSSWHQAEKLDGRLNWRTDGRKGGWMNEWMNGQMDKWTNDWPYDRSIARNPSNRLFWFADGKKKENTGDNKGRISDRGTSRVGDIGINRKYGSGRGGNQTGKVLPMTTTTTMLVMMIVMAMVMVMIAMAMMAVFTKKCETVTFVGHVWSFWESKWIHALVVYSFIHSSARLSAYFSNDYAIPSGHSCM